MSTPPASIVAVDDLAIVYGRRTVVTSASFEVPSGSVTALLGRNGAGKTSLLRCLLGVQRPSAGSVRVFGMDPWNDRVAVLHRTGVVAETPEAPAKIAIVVMIMMLTMLIGNRYFHSRFNN